MYQSGSLTMSPCGRHPSFNRVLCFSFTRAVLRSVSHLFGSLCTAPVNSVKMTRKCITLEFHGEYDKTTELLIGVWISFPGSRRTPFLWRDVGLLIQVLEDHGNSYPELTAANLYLLEPGEHILFGDVVEHDALNPLGSPLEWKL